MKKLMAGLLGLVLSMAVVVPSFAQNLTNRYDAYGIGTVNYSLNSGGSSYGHILNSATGSVWSLGSGTAQGTVSSTALSWNSSGQVQVGGAGTSFVGTEALLIGTSGQGVVVNPNGHLQFHFTTPPTASSCGTNPSVVSGSDQAGDITLGSTPGATCTLTFQAGWNKIPVCYCSNITTSGYVCQAKASATTVVLVGSGWTPTLGAQSGAANDVLQYGCIGWQ